MAVLQLLNGANPGQVFPLVGDRAILGRHPECDIVLDVGAVSRQHAQVRLIDGEYFVEDLGSRNGTYVNGQLIENRQRLKDMDQLQVCDLKFTFHRNGLPEDSPPRSGPMLLDDAPGRASSTIMSKIDMTLGDSGLRVQVKPEAKLKALFEITSNLRKTLAVEQVLPRILESLFKIFVQADRGFIVLLENGRLVPKAFHQRRGREDDVRISRTIINEVISSREAVLSADAASDARFDMSQSVADFSIRSMMCAPLLDSEGTALGVIQIDALERHGRFAQEDLDILVAVANQAAFAVENAQLHERALRQQAVERDLQLAHEVQRGLLPRRQPEVPGYDFFDFYEPANQVGGDYYGYVSLPDHRVAVVLADVAGKGVAAALLMARLSADVRYCLLNEPSAGPALSRLNRSFAANEFEGRFVTMVLAVLDYQQHRVVLANAGHMPPFLRHADGRVEPAGQEQAGIPLGIDQGFEYPQREVALEPGDCLTLFTDGISEAMNTAGQAYGLGRIADCLRRSSGNVESLAHALLEDVQSFVGGASRTDDMCLVAFGRRR